MGRLPDNYLGPKQRITMLKNDYPKEKSAILTESCAWVVGEALCLLIKASIQIDGKTIAQGHAFTDCPEEAKAVEKAETIAIGRALVNAGYPELDDGESVEEVEEKKEEKPKRAALGKTSRKEKEDESTDETEESDSEVSEETKPKKSGGLGKLSSSKGSSAKPKSGSSSDDTNESEEESEDEAEEESEEEEAEESSDKEEEKPKKLNREELLAKYRKK